MNFWCPGCTAEQRVWETQQHQVQGQNTQSTHSMFNKYSSSAPHFLVQPEVKYAVSFIWVLSVATGLTWSKARVLPCYWHSWNMGMSPQARDLACSRISNLGLGSLSSYTASVRPGVESHSVFDPFSDENISIRPTFFFFSPLLDTNLVGWCWRQEQEIDEKVINRASSASRV